MKSDEQNRCKKKTLYHSLGIEMPVKISSSFLMKPDEKSRTKFKVRRKPCITVLALKCNKRFLPVFCAET